MLFRSLLEKKADLTKSLVYFMGIDEAKFRRPIAEKAQEILKSYSNENGFAAVFDVSSQANSIIYFQDVADITTEIIRKIDSTPTKPASSTTAPKPPAGK